MNEAPAPNKNGDVFLQKQVMHGALKGMFDLFSTARLDMAINALNRALAADPEAMKALIEYRVPCNEALAKDPTIQVVPLPDQPGYQVGLLGIVNGMLGILGPEAGKKEGFGPVTMLVDNTTGAIMGFRKTLSDWRRRIDALKIRTDADSIEGCWRLKHHIECIEDVADPDIGYKVEHALDRVAEQLDAVWSAPGQEMPDLKLRMREMYENSVAAMKEVIEAVMQELNQKAEAVTFPDVEMDPVTASEILMANAIGNPDIQEIADLTPALIQLLPATPECQEWLQAFGVGSIHSAEDVVPKFRESYARLVEFAKAQGIDVDAVRESARLSREGFLKQNDFLKHLDFPGEAQVPGNQPTEGTP